jgi:hypothetical protein
MICIFESFQSKIISGPLNFYSRIPLFFSLVMLFSTLVYYIHFTSTNAGCLSGFLYQLLKKMCFKNTLRQPE